jgi:serine protease Do
MGTGILIDPRGYIITNQHVLDDVNVIRIRLSDGTTYAAKVAARDRDSDLALLKIDAGKPLPTVPLGTSGDLMIGETVIAIGNAYGYEHTVTSGIISALKRDVTLNKDISYRSLIQTDASINPGNSGGPLLNIDGELIGVNVAIRAGAQGIGFAIPVDQMVQVAAELLASRRRTESTAGLGCRNRIDTHLSPVRYLEVERVEMDGPAAKAGLKSGDVLLRAGDVSIASSLDWERALIDLKAGDRVPVKIRRGDNEQELEVVLQPVAPAALSPGDLAWRQLGMRLAAANPETVTRSNATLRGGMIVTEVDPDGPASRAGIQPGDVLVGLHQWEATSMDNVAYVMNHADLASFYPLRFYLLRSGQIHQGKLQPPR